MAGGKRMTVGDAFSSSRFSLVNCPGAGARGWKLDSLMGIGVWIRRVAGLRTDHGKALFLRRSREPFIQGDEAESTGPFFDGHEGGCQLQNVRGRKRMKKKQPLGSPARTFVIYRLSPVGTQPIQLCPGLGEVLLWEGAVQQKM